MRLLIPPSSMNLASINGMVRAVHAESKEPSWNAESRPWRVARGKETSLLPMRLTSGAFSMTQTRFKKLAVGILLHLGVLAAALTVVTILDHNWHAAAFNRVRWFGELLITVRVLAWPGLIAGRVGLTNTLPIVLVVLAGIFTIEWRLHRATGNRVALVARILALLPFAAFCAAGVLYLFVLPIPQSSRQDRNV